MDSIFSGSFADFNLKPELTAGLHDMGYTVPTIVQQKVFEPVSSQADFIVKSQTGSGKTAAFCLPLLNKLDREQMLPQVLVLLPTRELARQVTRECQRLSHHQNISVVCLYGGASIDAQISALSVACHVVVGTPGRVKDLLNKGHLKLSGIKSVVLDEADEMLSMGFWDDVKYILEKAPNDRQTLLFSATMPTEIANAAEQFMRNHQVIDVSENQPAVSTVTHIIHMEDESMPRPRNLLYALELHNPTKAVIFCNRREETEVISQYLSAFGYKSAKLNGELPQNKRESIVADLHENRINLLIATDIAARGLDFAGISHVFNYDMPDNEESYVHRIGRTGRIGREGIAVNLLRNKDHSMLSALESKHQISFVDMPLPKESEIMWLQAERLAQSLVESADGVEISQYRLTAAEMMKRGDAQDILAFLLRSYFRSMRARPEMPQMQPKALPGNFNRPQQERNNPRKNANPQTPRIAPPQMAASAPVARAGEAPLEAVADPIIEQSTATIPEVSNAPRPVKREPENKEVSAPTPPLFQGVRFFFSLGKKDGFTSLADLAFHIAKLANIEFASFTGDGRLQDRSAFLEVDKEVAQPLLKGIEEYNKTGEKVIRCERSSLPPQQRSRFAPRY